MQDQNRGIIIGGDLNLVLSAEEKIGGKYNVDPYREMLKSIIEACILMDMPPSN